MGQKINPIALRLSQNRTFDATWYNDDFSVALKNEFLVRKAIDSFLTNLRKSQSIENFSLGRVFYQRSHQRTIVTFFVYKKKRRFFFQKPRAKNRKKKKVVFSYSNRLSGGRKFCQSLTRNNHSFLSLRDLNDPRISKKISAWTPSPKALLTPLLLEDVLKTKKYFSLKTSELFQQNLWITRQTYPIQLRLEDRLLQGKSFSKRAKWQSGKRNQKSGINLVRLLPGRGERKKSRTNRLSNVSRRGEKQRLLWFLSFYSFLRTNSCLNACLPKGKLLLEQRVAARLSSPLRAFPSAKAPIKTKSPAGFELSVHRSLLKKTRLLRDFKMLRKMPAKPKKKWVFLKQRKHKLFSELENSLSSLMRENVIVRPLLTQNLLKSAHFLGHQIAVLFEKSKKKKRIPSGQIRKIIRRAMKKNSNCRGIRVLCSGRIGGVEKAKTFSLKKGQTSLNVFSNKIDFIQRKALTKYGIIGIKVWVNFGSENRRKA